MALTPESRAEWILARLEGDDAPGDAPPELVRDAAACREMWRALGDLDDRTASETLSPEARSRIGQVLVDAAVRETARVASRRQRHLAFGAVAAAAALVAIAALTVWRPVPRSPDARAASARLGAVLARTDENDPGAVRELGRALESDPNPNVRLAALGVLAERRAQNGLEDQVARALARESDPLVRLELIRTVGERRLVRNAPVLHDLTLDPQLDELTREEIARVLAGLGS
jgi:HEAT repeats